MKFKTQKQIKDTIKRLITTNFFVLIMLIFSIGVCAQTITISFTGQDAANHHVQLERVNIINHSQNWEETLYWPDTTLNLTNGVGINDNDDPVGFKLYQNNPNPFNGITDTRLTVADAGSVSLEITDANGRTIENRIYTSLPAGTHRYRVTLSAAGTYIMTVRQNEKTSSIKMINNGNGGKNSITQLEHVVGKIITKSGDVTNGNVNHPWAYGDSLTITGYSTICGIECTQQVSKQLCCTETITIKFSESITTPIVAASCVSNITTNSASVSSSVSGNCGVICRGFCYGISSNPIISGQHTINGSDTGDFTITLSGLIPGTTYYVRAYATNAAGTAYGDEVSFTSLVLQVPSVITDIVTNIDSTTATCGGEVTDDGGANVTTRGVCWSTYPNPTIADSHTIDGSGIGSFTSNITGLNAGTTYYVRAYATNSEGTAYGNEASFTTPVFICGTCTITDIDGNIYNTVQIGTQCWMKENLRTTRYADGTFILDGTGLYGDVTIPYRYYPNNNANNVPTYGYLYNWPAVMHGASSSSYNPSGVQGICPNGWHVPSDAEWIQLMEYVGFQSEYICGNSSDYICGYSPKNIAKALADTTGWNNATGTCAPGNDPSSNNATGFSALPAGLFWNDYQYFGRYALFWSATDTYNSTPYQAFGYCVENNYCEVGCFFMNYRTGISVRCIRD